MLLFLSERKAHGYELLERLKSHPDTSGIDAAALYRTLRRFEQDGLVRSAWDVEGAGAARRVYELTPDGTEHLHAWAQHIRSTRERLGRLLQAYEDHTSRYTKSKATMEQGG